MQSGALRTLFASEEAFDAAKMEAKRIVYQMVEGTIQERFAAHTLTGWKPAASAEEVVSVLAKEQVALNARMQQLHQEACSRIRQVEVRGLHMFEFHMQPTARTTSKLERQVMELQETVKKQSDCINQLQLAFQMINKSMEGVHAELKYRETRDARLSAAIATINNQIQQHLVWTADDMERNEDNAYPPQIDPVEHEDVFRPNLTIMNLPR